MSECICQISLFSQSHASQKWSICLYYDTTLHLLWSKRSSLWSDNIAYNWKDSFTFTACHWDCKDNPDQKSKKRKCFLVVLPPIQLVNVWGSIWDNLFINININININSFWNLLVGVVVTMILIKNWKKQKSWRNFWTISGLKISANPVPKNPGIPGLKILILLGPGKGSTF